MTAKIKLLNMLADGRFHSGERLGRAAGISRTMVWKHIQALEAQGVECHAVSGKGYRLARPLELLEWQAIEAALEPGCRPHLGGFELHPEIHSTNRHLMERLGELKPGHACLAEQQTAGRGRRGREWVSPFGRNIYLSIYWRFEMSPALLAGLGLAMGVAVIRALKELGIDTPQLKWPNDVLWQGRKLGGILLEMSGESGGPYHVVVGVGMNVHMAGSATPAIDQPWASLDQMTDQPVSRNRVAGLLLGQLLQSLRQFQEGGLEPFVAEWHQADAFAGQQVAIHQGDDTISGYERGIDTNGAIIVEVNGEPRRFYSGDVSLRGVR